MPKNAEHEDIEDEDVLDEEYGEEDFDDLIGDEEEDEDEDADTGEEEEEEEEEEESKLSAEIMEDEEESSNELLSLSLLPYGITADIKSFVGLSKETIASLGFEDTGISDEVIGNLAQAITTNIAAQFINQLPSYIASANQGKLALRGRVDAFLADKSYKEGYSKQFENEFVKALRTYKDGDDFNLTVDKALRTANNKVVVEFRKKAAPPKKAAAKPTVRRGVTSTPTKAKKAKTAKTVEDDIFSYL